MRSKPATFTMAGRAEARIVRTLAAALAVIFCWFGVQKLTGELGPAEEVAAATLHRLTAETVPVDACLRLLAGSELLIGIAVLILPRIRLVLWAAVAHLVLTSSAFAVFPDLMLGGTAGSLTLLGQHLVKNLVLLAGLYVLIELERANRPDLLAIWDDTNRAGSAWDWSDEIWGDDDAAVSRPTGEHVPADERRQRWERRQPWPPGHETGAWTAGHRYR